MSDSFATAPRLDSTTLTLRIYPKPPTDQPPTVFSPSHSLRLLLFSSLFSVVSHPLAAAAATRALSPYVDQATNSSPYACLPACFPIPHSILFVVARTLREKVTSQSRVSQDPANPSWYKIAPSGSQRRRCLRSRRNAAEDERRREIGIPCESRRCDTVDDREYSWLTDIAGLSRRDEKRSTNAPHVG